MSWKKEILELCCYRSSRLAILLMEWSLETSFLTDRQNSRSTMASPCFPVSLSSTISPSSWTGSRGNAMAAWSSSSKQARLCLALTSPENKILAASSSARVASFSRWSIRSQNPTRTLLTASHNQKGKSCGSKHAKTFCLCARVARIKRIASNRTGRSAASRAKWRSALKTSCTGRFIGINHDLQSKGSSWPRSKPTTE